MDFVFDGRLSDSSLVDFIWSTQSNGGGSFMSSASSNMEMVFTRQKGFVTVSLRGPETRATLAPVPEDAAFLGIVFKLGTFMPHVPAKHLVDGGIHLPEPTNQSFYLQGSAWQLPDFNNADVFVERLIHQGILSYEPLIEVALRGQQPLLSARSIQRRFRQVTGVTQGKLYQIRRAQYALELLQQDVSILDTVEKAGYYDQAHLTRSLKHFAGQTPAHVTNTIQYE
ncbi:AraC family transcriptional regulator [Phototrophicus methaneseepsis]|uniref:AraC family transcriptional regulator n=1 Tax=Phototrophicus methaneseepsis TaxID=2710758 RepID=A0A7S8IGA8_9CHLR|nr:helix-turn-helix domain-containing protein [Phototrophicus methaneseepsis]QPC84477.1 AraC family transcriptional regulator [Phototrophicus methaneseepsis]